MQKIKKAIVFCFDGIEIGEAVIVIDLLKRANIKVLLVTNKEEKIAIASNKMFLTCEECIKYINLKHIEYFANEYDCFILPGGKNQQVNAQNDIVSEKIFKLANQNKKIIGAICASPLTLYNWGIINDFNFCVFPSLKISELNNKKTTLVNKNIITSISLGTSFEFALAIIEKLLSKQEANKVKNQIIYKNK